MWFLTGRGLLVSLLPPLWMNFLWRLSVLLDLQT